jgi:hypothetical protein
VICQVHSPDDLLSVRTILLMIMFSQYLKDAWIPIPAKGGMKRYEKNNKYKNFSPSDTF